MQKTKEQILNRLKRALIESYGDEIQDVILFGSQLSNLHSSDSDYDILIILRDEFDWVTKRNIRNICYDISLENDIQIDSKIVSAQDINSKFWGKHPLFSDAIRIGLHAR